MKVRVIASLVTAVCLSFGTASASSIGPFFANDGSDCDADGVQPFAPFFIYIGAVLGGDAAGPGISGAEFQCTGVDPAWFNTVTPNPASGLALGTPIGGGCNIAFPGCMSGGFVLLYTVQSLALAPVTGRTLAVTQHTTPSNPNFLCPLVTLCDGPVFTKLCVSGGEAFLNAGRPCTVGVEAKSWSQVKSLFN